MYKKGGKSLGTRLANGSCNLLLFFYYYSIIILLNPLQDIHTNAFIAQALNSGGIRAEYLPPLITIIGFLMSFATGSVSVVHCYCSCEGVVCEHITDRGMEVYHSVIMSSPVTDTAALLLQCYPQAPFSSSVPPCLQ